MSIIINSSSSSFNLTDFVNKRKESEEIDIFAKHSDLGTNSKTYEDTEEINNDEYKSIVTKSDFTYNVLGLIKDGLGFEEAMDQTKEEQFNDLFARRIFENGGDPIEAVKYAKDRMSTDLSDEDLIEFVSALSAEYVSKDTAISEKLNEYANVLQDILDEKNKNLDIAGYKQRNDNIELENSDSQSIKSSLSVDNSIQDLVSNLNKFYEDKEKEEDVRNNPEKYSRSIIV